MPPSTDAPGMVETTAGALLPEHVGRVVHIPHPSMAGLLLDLEHGVDSPPLAGALEPAIAGATWFLLELPPRIRTTTPPTTRPVWLEPSSRVIVDERLDVGVCALCGQALLRTADDCWHPHTVVRACPPEPPLADRPPGFRTGRPGRDQWRPRPAHTALPEEPPT